VKYEIDTFYGTPKITYLAADSYIPGNYLVVIGYAIYTTKDYLDFELITGNSTYSGYTNGDREKTRFGTITGLAKSAQDDSQLWIADRDNGCIRAASRTNNHTYYLAGFCGKNQFRDGNFLIAYITRPTGGLAQPTKKKSTSTFFIDAGNSLRCICLNSHTWHILTVYVTLWLPNFITFNYHEDKLYFTTNSTVWIIDMSANFTHTNVLETSVKPRGHKDGEFGPALVNSPKGMYFLSPNVVIMADSGNNVLRVLDLKHSKMSTICVPQLNLLTESKEGDIEHCKMQSPRDIVGLHSNGLTTILVSTTSYIYRLHLRGIYILL